MVTGSGNRRTQTLSKFLCPGGWRAGLLESVAGGGREGTGALGVAAGSVEPPPPFRCPERSES